MAGPSLLERMIQRQMDRELRVTKRMYTGADLLAEVEALMDGKTIALQIMDDRGGSGGFIVNTVAMREEVAACPTCGQEVGAQ
jgi:hypothetical protein